MVFKNLRKDCLVKKSFKVRSHLKKISDQVHEHILKVCDIFEIKTMKDCRDIYLKFDVFSVS